MTVSTFAEPFTGTAHDDFSVWAREVREYRIERAYDRPTIKLYDGDWKYRGTVYGELSGRIQFVSKHNVSLKTNTLSLTCATEN